jgi:hypothetical protein
MIFYHVLIFAAASIIGCLVKRLYYAHADYVTAPPVADIFLQEPSKEKILPKKQKQSTSLCVSPHKQDERTHGRMNDEERITARI